MLFRTLPVASDCNKVSENEETSGNRYTSEKRAGEPDRESPEPPILIGAHMSIAGGVQLAIGRGEALGCTAIQIFTKNASQWKSPPLQEERIKEFKREQERTGILILAHDAYLINLASPDPKLLERSRIAFLDEMERAEQLEVPFLIMHPGAHKDSGEDLGIKTIIESFNLLLRSTSGFRVKIAVENTAGQGSASGYSFQHLQRMVTETVAPERMAVCFDTCHAFAAGYDFRDAAGYQRAMDELDAAVGLKRLAALHLNDSKKGLGLHVDRHEHIGVGMLGLEPFRFIMNDRRLSGVPKVLETPKELDGQDMDVVNLKILRELIQ